MRTYLRWWILPVIVLCLCDEASAQPDPHAPPFAPWAVNLPELGRMRGSISPCLRRGSGEEFGRDFASVGDVNNDGLADWVVSSRRCDTVVHVRQAEQVWERIPEEVILFLGLLGGLPESASGIRLGPGEGDALTRFLAAGDFDADGNRDVVLSVERLLDSSDGNARGYSIQSVIIFWGDGTGRFSLGDTTRLPCETEYWIALVQAVAQDFDNDGTDDLLIYGLSGFRQGAPTKIPTLRILAGARGRRWGRETDRPRLAVWLKWNAWSVTHGRLAVLDQDCDGTKDIVFYYDNNAGPSRITVLYGRAGDFPDTNAFETLEPIVANGRSALFGDVTGDGSPELLLNCGNHQSVKIFAGRPGQRLLEQYGSGLDTPIAGKQWWSRPWAEIWTPSHLEASWSPSGYSGFLELGDVSTDGIDEVWIYSEPYIMGYRTLERMDSLSDVWLRYNGEITHAARLGDIDGSGRVTVAVSYDFYPHDLNFPFPGEMIFLQATPEVTGLAWINPRRVMPHVAGDRCGETPTAVVDDVVLPGEAGPTLTIRPNPSGEEVALELVSTQLAGSLPTYEITDVAGAVVLRGTFQARTRGSVRTDILARGVYSVRVVSDGRETRGLLRAD